MKEYIYGQGKRPSSDIKNADIVLEESYDIANELGFNPVLWHGTCLGLYRDGKYTHTDNDIDIAISGSDKERDVYFKKLLDTGFEEGSVRIISLRTKSCLIYIDIMVKLSLLNIKISYIKFLRLLKNI